MPKPRSREQKQPAGRLPDTANTDNGPTTPLVPGMERSLRAGMFAPEIELQDDGGVTRRLSDFRGRPIVLYFYPEDDTPGCTKEACNFRDDYSSFEEAGVTILGVSPDSVDSHAEFKKKYNLPFKLLADPDRAVCLRYGVWGHKKMMGISYEGVLRTTFLIDRSGRIARIFENVRPSEHSAEILVALREAQ